MITTPTSPIAKRLVFLIKDESADNEIAFFGVSDATAFWPAGRASSGHASVGLFGGNPRLPAEDVATVGSSYRLMARADLSRSLAAEVTQHLFEMRSALDDRVPAAMLLRVRPTKTPPTPRAHSSPFIGGDRLLRA